MNDALPIQPLRHVVSGESPLKNPLHVLLLIVLWLLPPSLFYWAIAGYMQSHYEWSDVAGYLPYLLIFGVVATVLSLLVGRSASKRWTLAVHGLCAAAVWAWISVAH
jgi:hypothetical protein